MLKHTVSQKVVTGEIVALAKFQSRKDAMNYARNLADEYRGIVFVVTDESGDYLGQYEFGNADDIDPLGDTFVNRRRESVKLLVNSLYGKEPRNPANKIIVDGERTIITAPHAFAASYSGMVCDYMVSLPDGSGDACGLPSSHPIHNS